MAVNHFAGWKFVPDSRFPECDEWMRGERVDGAVVRIQSRAPTGRWSDEGAMLWIAFGPGEEENQITQPIRNSLFTRPRRWRSSKAAILAVNKLFPL